MHDFTITSYSQLIKSLLEGKYYCQTFEEFIQKPLNDKVVVLRHDVDKLPNNALRMAELENRLGINASYYFRVVKESYDENIIRRIADMGHEIGYHYECLATVSKKMRGLEGEKVSKRRDDSDDCMDGWKRLYEVAIDDFRLNIEKLRKIYPVKTICMHGSPLSKYDNRKIWEKYDYRDYGIIAEPYFDVDFDEVFYLTDTGRAWNNFSASVRDKVKGEKAEDSKGKKVRRSEGEKVRAAEAEDGRRKVSKRKDDLDDSDGWMKSKGPEWPRFHSTFEIIRAVDAGTFPDKVMMTVHPQRWNDYGFHWYKELVGQNVKNVVKRILVGFRD